MGTRLKAFIMKTSYLLLLGWLYSCVSPQNPDQSTHTSGSGHLSTSIPDSTPYPANQAWSLDYLMGKFDPVTDSNFIEIKLEHADRTGLYLRKDTYSAFIRMYEAAQHDSIRLVIRSATRNFENQKRIWENKWTGETPLESNRRANLIADETMRAKEILKYSSMPGSSRHHWGTDIDLNAFNNRYFEEGEGLKIYQWLSVHAFEFGFCQPYTKKGISRPTGYEEEKWHWSFLRVSGHLIRLARASLRDDLINGFEGSEQAIRVGIVDNYVLGIDSLCLNIENQTDLISN